MRILITGSTDGLGRAGAASLLDVGHEVVVHARSPQRLAVVAELTSLGAEAIVGDLARPDEVASLAEDVSRFGPIDAVIHNAGIIDGPDVLPANVIAPYLLTALVPAARVIYLSSGMHRGGRAELTGIEQPGESVSYSDSKLLVTALMAAVARRRPDVISHAVDPGWVPTKMGGPSATDDLALGHVTQAWLAATDDPAARDSGGYWRHQRIEEPHPTVQDEQFQDELCAALERPTGVSLPRP